MLRQRQPRERDPQHLTFIRSLPCVICGSVDDQIHAAHIRAAAIRYGKRQTGMGEKPDDRWTLPLCAAHHVFGRDAVHKDGDEVRWFHEHGINPFVTALALFGATGKEDEARTIIQLASLSDPRGQRP